MNSAHFHNFIECSCGCKFCPNCHNGCPQCFKGFQQITSETNTDATKFNSRCWGCGVLQEYEGYCLCCKDDKEL
jgi:hypothetical protein